MPQWFNPPGDDVSPAKELRRALSPKIVLPLLAVWLLAIAVYLAFAIDHAARPASPAAAALRWPPATRLEPATGDATLVMFVHPECPCTEASLEQFEAVLKSFGGATRAHVVVVGEGSASTSRNAVRASRISAAKITFDPAGAESRRFGSRTSGDLLIYNGRGELVFCGGITAGRGHQGDNLAAAVARSAISPTATELVRTPVFGCGLRNHESAAD